MIVVGVRSGFEGDADLFERKLSHLLRKRAPGNSFVDTSHTFKI
jgi:hypothetical protein